MKRWLIAVTLALAACRSAPAATPTAPLQSSTASAPPVEVASTPTAAPIQVETPAPVAEAPVTMNAEVEEINTLLATLYDGRPFRGAVLVARQGQVIHRKGYGLADADQGIPNTPETRFRLGSVTKPITALAVLLLAQEGRVQLDASVCVYLAGCPSAWQPISLDDLLTHRSGIPDLTRFPDFEATKAQPSTPLETLARFAGKPLDFAPGDHWEYSNSNYIVLGIIVEQVTGQAYETVIQDRIFTPLGMTNSGYDHNLDTLAVGYKPDGSPADFLHMSIPFAAGGLYSTVDDLYKLDRALVEGRLLPEALTAAIFSIHAPFGPRAPEGGYGYGWMIMKQPAGWMVGHNGGIEGFSAGIWRTVSPPSAPAAGEQPETPTDDVLIISLSNEEQRDPNLVAQEILALLAEQN